MLRVCRRAAAARISIFLCGGTNEIVERLRDNLVVAFPGLEIAGIASPPFVRSPSRRTKPSWRGFIPAARKSSSSPWDVRNRTTSPTSIGIGLRRSRFALGPRSAFMPESRKWPRPGCSTTGWSGSSGSPGSPRRLMRRYLVTNPVFVARVTGEFLRRQIRPEASGARPLDSRRLEASPEGQRRDEPVLVFRRFPGDGATPADAIAPRFGGKAAWRRRDGASPGIPRIASAHLADDPGSRGSVESGASLTSGISQSHLHKDSGTL